MKKKKVTKKKTIKTTKKKQAKKIKKTQVQKDRENALYDMAHGFYDNDDDYEYDRGY